MKNNQLQKNIPISWKTYKLGNLVDIVNGKTPLRSRSDFWIDGTIPWFTIDDIRSNGRFINQTNQTVTDVALKESGIKIIPENSTLICCTASVGEYALTKIPLTTNQQFNALVPKDRKVINPLFLYYITQTFDSRLKQIMGSTTFGFVSVGTLSDFDIEIPSDILEQEKIAEILSKVDEDTEKTEKVIEETEKLKKGLMKELLTKGKKFKIKDISEINPEQIIPKEESEYSYIDIASIDDFQVNNPKSFLGKNSPSRARRLVKTNDVIISTVRPNLRAFSYIKPDYNNFLCSTGFCVLRTNNKLVNSKYLYYSILQDSFVEYLVGKTTGSNYPAVSSSDIGEYILNLPSLDEQEKIAEIISSIDEKISVDKKLKEKLTKLKKGLMSDLLSGKVRVINNK